MSLLHRIALAIVASIAAATLPAHAGIDVPKSTVGLEWEIGCMKVVGTVKGHSREKPKFDQGQAQLFRSKATCEGGLPCVEVTRDQFTEHARFADSKSGELEVVTGPFVYDDDAKQKLILSFISNFFKAAKAGFESDVDKEVWGTDPSVEALAVDKIFKKMTQLAGDDQDLKPVGSGYKANSYLLKMGGICRAAPQVNFGFVIQNYVKAKTAMLRHYSDPVVKAAYEKCTTEVQGFLSRELSLRAKKADPLVQSAFCLWAVVANASAQASTSDKEIFANVDVTKVAYKNAFGMLPKMYLGDLFRVPGSPVRNYKGYWNDIRGVNLDPAVDMLAASFCAKKDLEAKCRLAFRESLFFIFGAHPDNKARYGDGLWAQPGPKAKKVWAPAPKPLPTMLIAKKPAVVFETRTVDQALEISNEKNLGTWEMSLNFSGLDPYGSLGTLGSHGKTVPKVSKKFGDSDALAPPPPPPPGLPPEFKPKQGGIKVTPKKRTTPKGTQQQTPKK